MKRTMLTFALITITIVIHAQQNISSINVFGNNPIPSVNGFLNKIQFTGGNHGALVFHPDQKDELMFGLHTNGNFYWGTGRNANKPNYYSMYLNGSNGNLTARGIVNTKAVSVNGNNPVSSVNGFLNKVEFTGGSHGALVFHPNKKDELMFGLHTNGNFYWGTGRNANKPNFYSMYLNGSNGNLTAQGIVNTKAISVKGNNPISSVNGFLNKIEFTGGSHGALVFHPNKKDELMFGLHTNGNFYWGTGRNANKPNYYSMYLNGNNGDLGIRGKLTANEVKVKIGGWADFVFKKDYQLPSLAEVEAHINKNGHLKDIPNAKEVVANGVFIGEMNVKLLQKIEELTLYTIQQEKKIKLLEKENDELKSLYERVDAIERLLEK